MDANTPSSIAMAQSKTLAPHRRLDLLRLQIWVAARTPHGWLGDIYLITKTERHALRVQDLGLALALRSLGRLLKNIALILQGRDVDFLTSAALRFDQSQSTFVQHKLNARHGFSDLYM